VAAKLNQRLHAAFASTNDARDCLDRLARANVPAEDIEVRSSAPLWDDIRPAGLKLHSRVVLMAVLGGLLGGTAFFLMVEISSRLYPLRTGGFPIVALPAAGIITFEGVAIGAIISTAATVVYECRLPSLSPPGPLDHYLADDYILVSVRCAEDAPTDWTAGAIETARG
jgi:hypothetical protein